MNKGGVVNVQLSFRAIRVIQVGRQRLCVETGWHLKKLFVNIGTLKHGWHKHTIKDLRVKSAVVDMKVHQVVSFIQFFKQLLMKTGFG